MVKMKVLFRTITALTYLSLSVHSSDWTKEFELIGGSKIIRTPESITIIDSDASESSFTELQIEENTTSQGITPVSTLYLDLGLSQEDFTISLIDSGIYAWTKKYDLSKCIITRYPDHIKIYLKDIGKFRKPESSIVVQNILLDIQLTRTEFEENIQKLKELKL